MDLIPHRGFGQVLLGITEDKAIALLGEPDAKASDNPDIPGGECHSWVYERLGVELSFDQDVDYRLARIRFTNPDAVLNGHKPIGLPELELGRARSVRRLAFSLAAASLFRTRKPTAVLTRPRKYSM